MTWTPATTTALACAGLLFWVGLWLGVWKYVAIRRSPEAVAPEYVSIAHRAALMYAFACVLLGALAQRNALPSAWAQACVLGAAATFVMAIAAYALHGWLRDTDNQFRPPMGVGPVRLHSAWVDGVMVLKAGIELAAAGALLLGFVLAG